MDLVTAHTPKDSRFVVAVQHSMEDGDEDSSTEVPRNSPVGGFFRRRLSLTSVLLPYLVEGFASEDGVVRCAIVVPVPRGTHESSGLSNLDVG